MCLPAGPEDHLRPTTLTLRAWSACFVPCFLAAAFPVIISKFPPVSDYINHLARCYVIAYHSQEPLLAHFYRISWRLIPNLAIDLIVPTISRVTGIYLAGKIFLMLTLLLLILGPHLVYRTVFKRWSLGPMVAALFVYSGAIETGAVNYLFGIGVALLAIAAWIQLRRGSVLVRGAVSVVFIVALYVCHFAALGLYGVALIGFEIWQILVKGERFPEILHSLAAVAVPFSTLPVLALLGPGGNDLAHSPIRWTLYGKIRALHYVLESQSLSRLPDAIVGSLMLGLLLLAWRWRLVRLHPAGWSIAWIGLATFLATPIQIMSAWGADVRQPLGYLFILTGFLDWQLATARARNAFLLAVVSLLAVRLGVVGYAWITLSGNSAQMAQSFTKVRPGSKILIAEVDHPRYAPAHTLHYLPCEAMIERESLCSLAFSDPRQQVLTVRQPYRKITGGFNDDPPELSELLSPGEPSAEAQGHRGYWANWPQTYDYLYVLSTTASMRNPLPNTLSLLYAGQHFRLYAVIRH